MRISIFLNTHYWSLVHTTCTQFTQPKVYKILNFFRQTNSKSSHMISYMAVLTSSRVFSDVLLWSSLSRWPVLVVRSNSTRSFFWLQKNFNLILNKYTKLKTITDNFNCYYNLIDIFINRNKEEKNKATVQSQVLECIFYFNLIK